MRRVAALLAAVLAAGAATLAAGCGGDGAEPGAPDGATLVLDFTPNAAHAGIYAALDRGYYEDEGVDLEVQPPGDSTDGPKLLQAGRIEFAVMDIHDFGIARERGFDLRAVAPIVQRPLASVVARADGPVRRPRDLEGRLVGVTGLPSDDAVLDSVVQGDGGDPAEVERVTIGFNAVASLAAGKVDAVTAFWNAEGVALRRRGVPVRIFKVDDYGAPRYPELVLVAADAESELVEAVTRATRRGYEFVGTRPQAGLAALLDANPQLDRAEQEAQLTALGTALSPAPFNPQTLQAWARWDLEHGILAEPVAVADAFSLSPAG